MRILTIAFLCLFCITKGISQDRFFGFNLQSNVIPKGTRQVEVWYANKNGGYSYYNGNYARIGLKMGLGKNVLSEFFVNVSSEAYVYNEISHSDKKTRVFDTAITQYHDVSFSNELKIKLLDPVANPIGMAIYHDLTIGTKALKFNPKIIFDKRVGQHFFTLNLSAEFDRKFEIDKSAVLVPNQAPTIVKEKEVPLEVGFAYMAFSKNNKSGFGLEARNHNEIIDIAGWEHSALYVGPAVHFRGDNWFFNLTALPQVANLRKTWIAPDNHVWDEHQKFELRTVVGFTF